MTVAVLINGAPPQSPVQGIPADDRGFNYGDGVFETALLTNARVRFLEAHLQRLEDGCERLGLRAPDRAVLVGEIDRLTNGHREGVVKMVVTRGAGGRGYRPDAQLEPTRVMTLHPAPLNLKNEAVLRWCATPLGRNPRLAGIKHLNRLEQVLAHAEWNDPAIDEGLMLDTEGELVCGAASNVFVVRDGALATADLRYCGVRGVMRAQVLSAAQRIGIAVHEEPLWPHDLDTASEVFLTNAVRGIRSALSLEQMRWPAGPVAHRLRVELGL